MGRRGHRKKENGPPSLSSPPQLTSPVDTDDGLLDDLLAQLDEKDEVNREETATVLKEMELNSIEESASAQLQPQKKSSRVRHLARQAKKVAALVSAYSPDDPEADSRIQLEKENEEAAIKTACESLGLYMHEVNPDGNCLYSAIADQLALLGIIAPQDAHFQTTRNVASAYMLDHPNHFLPFLPSIDGEDGAGATETSGLMNPEDYAKYCSIIRETSKWGGEPEITALAEAFSVPIHVIQSGAPPIVVHNPTKTTTLRSSPVFISYHRRMYGLGEHYNSLRPRTLMVPVQ